MLNTMRHKSMMPLLVIINTVQVFKFMLGSVKHELGVNDISDMTVKKHALLSSWHISVGPYKDYKLVNTAAKHLSGLNYEVKAEANKNNPAYFWLMALQSVSMRRDSQMNLGHQANR